MAQKHPEFLYGKSAISGHIWNCFCVKKCSEKYSKRDPKWITYGKVSLAGGADGSRTANMPLTKMNMILTSNQIIIEPFESIFLSGVARVVN